MKGCIHIYTGDGKGKTTAALGLALRTAGYGKRVVIVQFLKGSESGEIISLAKHNNILVFRNRRDYGFYSFLNKEEREAVKEENDHNLQSAVELIQKGFCDLLILDEALPAYTLMALDKAALEALVYNKPYGLELVLTGREPHVDFIAAADYISEIKKIKHPFDSGLSARKGVEY